jgi:Short C-terminal domain
MALGPLEYLVVACEENHFMDQILPELRAAWEKGIIRIVDLFLFSKNESGNIAALQLNDLSGEKADHLALLSDDLLGLLTPDNIEQLARAMLNNRSVVILLFEHPWVVDLKETINHAGGICMAEGLVISGVLQKLEEAFQASPQPAGQNHTNPDVSRQLKQVGALHDSKVITEAEYERAKKEILGN